jgi:hypothetical protein
MLVRIALHGGDLVIGPYGKEVSRIRALLNGGCIKVVLTELARDMIRDEIARYEAMPPEELGQVTLAGWKER